MSTFRAIVMIVSSLLLGMTRGEFIVKVMDYYKDSIGVDAIAWHEPCPFTDIDGLPEVCEAWEIGITAGTSATTFSPDDKLEPYQSFIIIGKLMMVMGDKSE